MLRSFVRLVLGSAVSGEVLVGAELELKNYILQEL